MNIVFAHFKTKLPKHLLLNIQRTIALFPDHQIFLISDRKVTKLNISGLATFHFTESPEWLEIENTLDHPKDFRGNFWFTSLSRFIAISHFANMHDGPLLHIESDVIISPNFPFEALSRLKSSFAYPIVSHNQAIASCLFILNKDAAAELAKITLETVRLNPSTTDMYVLHELFTRYPEKVQILPTSPAQENAFLGVSQDFLNQTLESVGYFKGIFDGFDIGRYLFGDDPRNDRGFSVLRMKDPRTYLDASKLDFLFIRDGELPFVRDEADQSILPIYALHIHSKNLKLFKMRKARKILRKSVSDSQKKSQRIFSIIIFLKCTVTAIRRRYIPVKISS